MTGDSNLATVREILLHQHKLRVSARIPREMLKLSLRDEVSDVCDELLAVLEESVYVEQAEHTLRTRVPSSWWEHLKWQHAPAWFTQRWPVRYTYATETVQLGRFFPAFMPRDMGKSVTRVYEYQRTGWDAPA